MGNHAGWTETEVRAAVGEYFALLRAEQEGRQVNKAALYRRLAKQARAEPVTVSSDSSMSLQAPKAPH